MTFDQSELQKLLDAAKNVIVSDEILLEQRVSFVYGNAPRGSRITKESARASTKNPRVIIKEIT
jgi:hypothetical protein